MSEVAGIPRREFDDIKTFMYRGFTRQELNDLRRRGLNAREEQVRRWLENEREEQARV